jgi:hypothetical protein
LVSNTEKKHLPRGTARYDGGDLGLGMCSPMKLAEEGALEYRLWVELRFPLMRDLVGAMSGADLLLLRNPAAAAAAAIAAAAANKATTVASAEAAAAAALVSRVAAEAAGAAAAAAVAVAASWERASGGSAFEATQARQTRADAAGGDTAFLLTTSSPRKQPRFSAATTQGGTGKVYTHHSGAQPVMWTVSSFHEQAKMAVHDFADQFNAQSDVAAQLKRARDEGAVPGKAAEVMLAGVMTGEIKLDLPQLARQILSEENLAHAKRIHGGDFGGIESNQGCDASVLTRSRPFQRAHDGRIVDEGEGGMP